MGVAEARLARAYAVIGQATGAETATPLWFRLAPSANARSLAVLRIATGVIAVRLGYGWIRSDWVIPPPELWYPPTGTRWAAGLIPISSSLLQAGSLVFFLAAIFVLVGYRARAAAVVAVVAGIYVGWAPQLLGKVDHYHHVIWFLALLALAPCDDRLAIGKSKPLKSPEAYAMPALAGVLILGVIYLSSGLPKLETGLDWALSDNLRNLMWNLWWEKQYIPPLPIDQWPLVYKAMGLGTLAFEMLFLPAALYPPTRRWIRWIGIGFHIAIRVFLAINFLTLAVLYVVLFDWGKGPQRTDAPAPHQSALLAPLALVVIIALGATIPAGWPLSGYPGFAGNAVPRYTEFELVGPDGGVYVTRSGLAEKYGPHRARPLAAVAMVKDRVPALLQHASELEGRQPDYYQELRVVVISTNPATPGKVLTPGS